MCGNCCLRQRQFPSGFCLRLTVFRLLTRLRRKQGESFHPDSREQGKKKACLYVMCAWTRATVLIQSHLEHIPRPHYGYGSQANQFARRLFLSSFLLPSYLHASLGHFFFFSEAPKSFDCQHFDLMCQTIADFKDRHVLSVLGPALTILFSLFLFDIQPKETFINWRKPHLWYIELLLCFRLPQLRNSLLRRTSLFPFRAFKIMKLTIGSSAGFASAAIRPD